MKTTVPTEQAIPLSGEDDEGKPFLSVVVKRTYWVDPRGRGQTTLAESQLPLHTLIVDDDEPEVVLQEADVYPLKHLTDVVVRGHAYAPAGKKYCTASVAVGPLTKNVFVVGDRTCALSSSGAILLSEPAPFESIPLEYRRAYGGVDTIAEAKYGNPYAKVLPYVAERLQRNKHSPYRYPRNGVGKGYLIEPSREALEALALPNFEDPSDRLGPDRLAATSTLRWPLMPLPWVTDWQSLACFPRIGYLGGTPMHTTVEGGFPEVRRGYMPAGYPRGGAPRDMWHGRARNAGSFGLQIAQLTAEAIESVDFRLQHLHPKRDSFAFRLPAGGPKIWIDGRNGKLVATKPVVHHVVIEPDKDLVSIVWRGMGPAIRRYSLDELETIPFRVEW